MKISNFFLGDTFIFLEKTLLQSVTQHFLFQNIVVFAVIVAFRVVERVVTTVAAIELQLSAEVAFIAQSGNLSS